MTRDEIALLEAELPRIVREESEAIETLLLPKHSPRLRFALEASVSKSGLLWLYFAILRGCLTDTAVAQRVPNSCPHAYHAIYHSEDFADARAWVRSHVQKAHAKFRANPTSQTPGEVDEEMWKAMRQARLARP